MPDESSGGSRLSAAPALTGHSIWRRPAAASAHLIRSSAERQQILAGLVRVVESDVVPRLVLARTPHLVCSCAPPPSSTRPLAQDVAAFAHLLLTHDAVAAASHVIALHAQGVRMEAIFLDLLTPAAHHVRRLWKEDARDLLDVTHGLCRLQLLVRQFSPLLQSEAVGAGERGRSALLVATASSRPAPELAIVEVFFRRAGWRVEHGLRSADADPAGFMSDKRCDVVCLWVAGNGWVGSLAGYGRAVRQASRRAAAAILIGDAAVVEHPDVVRQAGFDAAVADGREVVAVAERMLSLLEGV